MYVFPEDALEFDSLKECRKGGKERKDDRTSLSTTPKSSKILITELQCHEFK